LTQACEKAEKVGDRLFEEWQVYEKLVTHDYMDHRAFFKRLQAEIVGRFDHPVTILDLGCGDLTPILPILPNLPLQQYVGIDESGAALALASGHLQALQVPGRLIKGDLLVSLAEMDDSFDIILASFSLHHFADQKEKRATLEAARQHLNPEGFIAVIDVFCAQDELREQYLERWIKHAENRYVELHAEEKELLFDHVRARDFPVSQATFQSLGREAGLPGFALLLEDRARLNALVTFSPGQGLDK
jgi:SAM-dependent methyltransferase